MQNFDLLKYILITPFLTALLIFCHSSFKNFNKKTRNLISTTIFYLSSCVQVAYGIMLYYHFDPSNTSFQFTCSYPWIEKFNINFSLGVDSLSLYFIILTIFLTPLCVLAGLEKIKQHRNLFIISFLLLESCIIGVFTAKDLILFYVFFEAFLIPMYLVIIIWGGENRVYAAIKFFIYTFAGSVLMLLAIIYVITMESNYDLVNLSFSLPYYSLKTQKLLWLAFFVSFAIKVPLWPFHTWLPDAHVQAPTSGSIILAGILLKVGGYGLIRFNLSMFPEASLYFSQYVMWLSIIAVLYTSIVAVMQEDIKKMIAYSSVAHMGYVVAGIFSFNQYGITGSIFQMLSHGIISSALFFCIGILYNQTGSKKIELYKGLAAKMPKFSFFLTIFIMSSIALPGTSGFIGEFFILLSVFKVKMIYGVFLSLGVVLGAVYMLWLYIRTVFGNPESGSAVLNDPHKKDLIILFALSALTILMGIYPAIVTDNIDPFVNHFLEKTKVFIIK